MCRLLAVVLLAVLVWFGSSTQASAEAPLCALSPDFERQVLANDAVVGAAVYDLQTGSIWSGGHAGPFALHSVIKPPIAWAVLSDAYETGRPLTKLHRDALYYMVALSFNPDVTTLLSMIGGLQGLNDFYQRWGVPELIELAHRSRWGASRAQPVHLARLFAALAMSETVPELAREHGFDLLRDVVDGHRWGATIPQKSLPGWESLIKTGNFTLPESSDGDPVAKIDPHDYLERHTLLSDLYDAPEAAQGNEERHTAQATGQQRPRAGQDEQRRDLAGGAVARQPAALRRRDHAGELLHLGRFAEVPGLHRRHPR